LIGTIVFTLAVDPGTAAGLLTNTVAIASRTEDDDRSNNTFTQTSTVDVLADVSIVKSHLPEPAVAGSVLTYTLIYSNAGPSLAYNVAITDELPSGVRFEGIVIESPPLSGPTRTGQTLTWYTPTLAPGVPGTIVFTTSVTDRVTSLLTNTVIITTSTPDDKPGNDSQEDVATIGANLTITKTSSPANVVPGTNMTYVITVSNLGPSPVVSATVDDDLSAILQDNKRGVQWDCTASPGGQCEQPTAGARILDVEVTVPVLGWVVYTATGELQSQITETVVNTATVTAPAWVTEPDLNDNQAVDRNQPKPRADLSVRKTVDNPRPAEGWEIVYTVVVSSSGPSDARKVSITDTLPLSVTHKSHFATRGGYDENTGIWYFRRLGAGLSETLTITCTVNSGTTGSIITNTAEVTSDSPPDFYTANNTSSVTITVMPAYTDLAVHKSAEPGPAIAEEVLTYTVVFTNNIRGASAQNVYITDTLPAGVRWTGWASTAPPLWGPTQTGRLLVWYTPTLGIDDTPGTITFTVLVTDRVIDTLTNTVEITSSLPDQQPGNNKASHTTTITTNLTITKTSVPTRAVPGLEMTYTITVTNLGPSPVVSATVYDQLPDVFEANPAISWECLPPLGYACTAPANGARILSDTVTLPASGRIVYTATGVLTSGVSGSVMNTAVVTAPFWVTEPDTGDNQATDSNDVAPQADVGVRKTVDRAKVNEGDEVVYTVVVSNAGPSDTFSVSVSDTLPLSVTHTSHEETGGSYNENTGVWDLSKLEAGGVATLTITCTVGTDTAGQTIANTAEIAGTASPDPNPSNDRSSAAFKVNSPPDAVDDWATTIISEPVTINVLDNDTDPDGDPLTVADIRPPLHGSNIISGTETVVYTPTVGYIGTDTFTYTVSDGLADATGWVTVTVDPFSVAVSGPSQGQQSVAQTFTATVGPTATLPLTYTWMATEQSAVQHAPVYSLTDSIAFTWSHSGSKTVTAAVSNVSGTVTSTHVITIQ
jgi:uncharacterized repeat protein (TIGR01451 family)